MCLVLKPKNLSTVQPVQILRHGDIMHVGAELANLHFRTHSYLSPQNEDGAWYHLSADISESDSPVD